MARSSKILITVALLATTAPAGAITRQETPKTPNGESQLVDPDERAEHMVESVRQSDQRTYARPVLNNSSLVGGSTGTPSNTTGFRPFP